MTRDLIKWEDSLPAQHWDVYRCVLDRVTSSGIPFALGGGLALGVYTDDKVRDAKDIDLYVLPADRERCIEILTNCGLEDYFTVKEYCRHWIYRGHKDEAIVDVIWAMANQRTDVDERWVEDGPVIRMFDTQFRVIPIEELIWSKLYVLQRDRCDWPDILNLLNAAAESIDWEHLLERTGEDRALIKGVLSVYSWVCAPKAKAVPRRVWDKLGLAPMFNEHPPQDRPSPKDLLDTRPWLVDRCAA